MKAKPGKVTVSSKAKSAAGKASPAAKKVTAKAVPARASSAASPAKKATSKSPKPAAPAKKTPAPVVKKAVAKPAPKPATRTATKPAAKAAPKPAPKAAPKAPAKSVTKPAAKVSAKAGPKTVASVAPTPASARTGAKVAAAPKSAPKPATPAAGKTAPSGAAAVAGGASATKSPVAVAHPHEVPRSPKPSARLAQVTVPSMAQATASTAAKASFVPTMSQTLIVPPLPSAIKKDPKLANNWKTKPAEALTDEELMAMPDGEYMNDKQMAAFRVRLLRLKQDILNNAGETTEHLREETVIVPDPADRATIEEEHALELRTRDRERKLLKKIEQSIARIDAGDYGYCDETGEPIGVGRLLARPTATLSLEAQQRRELKQKMFGD